MEREIERKFFLKRYPSAEICSGRLSVRSVERIEQTYLALDEEQEIRVRKIADESGRKPARYTHTFKRGHGLSREEAEYEISAAIYEQLTAVRNLRPLVKTRTRLAGESGLVAEIDQYEQFDLSVVEVEFADEDEAGRFVPPEWFGEEIDGYTEYSNKKLWKKLQLD